MTTPRRAAPHAFAAVLLALACSAPNPLYQSGRDGGGQPDGALGDGGRPGSDALPGTGGAPGTGGLDTGGAPGLGGVPGAGGEPGTGGEIAGTGGMVTPGTGGEIAPGTGGMVTPGTGGMVPPATGGSGGTSIDVGPPPDLVTTPDLGTPPASCGTGHPDLTGITGARGIAIDSDGTIYFTRESGTQAWVGRHRRGMPIESSWRTLPANAQPRMLRVDSGRHLVYIPCAALNNVYVVNTQTAIVSVTVTNVMAPHGVAIAEDGYAYVSAGDGHVYRFFADFAGSAPVLVTSAPVFPSGQRPLGLAFGATGHLYVGSSNGGIKRFSLQDRKLVDPRDHGTFTGPASDLAFDIEGRLYVAGSTGSARQLFQLSADGLSPAPVPQVMGRLSGLAFALGGLDCRDLVVSAEGEATQVWAAGQAGLAQP
jgi:sugar lactone lactonase YvrE